MEGHGHAYRLGIFGRYIAMIELRYKRQLHQETGEKKVFIDINGKFRSHVY